MQNIILITFKSGLVQYIPHNLEALDFISANFADIENYIVIEPAVQQKSTEKPPVDLSDLTRLEIGALAAALKTIEVETEGEFGTLCNTYNYKQNFHYQQMLSVLKELNERHFTLSDGSTAFISINYPFDNPNHKSAITDTTIVAGEGLYNARQYIYDQAGLK